MALILLAHDARDRQQTSPELLTGMGHTYVLCNNTENIISLYSRHMPDLIILDQKKAFYECERLRAAPETCDVPIIIISKLHEEADILRAYKMGANKYLTKPVNRDMLELAISFELDRVRRQKSAEEKIENKVIVAERYRLKRVVGLDKHSAIFIANDTLMDNSEVVLRLIREKLVIPEVVEQLREVAEKIKQARCDSLIPLLDVGEYENRPYLVYKLFQGETLEEHLKNSRLTEKEATKLGLDIVRALLAMKKKGSLHLDLKPDNIIMTDDHYMLTNFGLIVELDTSIFNTGFGCWGDPAFLCPEFFTGDENLTARSDVYSLGLIIYTAITGTNPYTNINSEYVVYKQVLFDAQPLHDKNPSISVAFSTIISSMMNKKASKRPRLLELEIAFNQILMMLEIMPKDDKDKEDEETLTKTGDETIDIPTNKQNKVLMEIYEDRLRKEAEEDALKKAKATKIKIIALIILVILLCGGAFIGGWAVFASANKKYPYNNGPMVVFTCYNGHQHEKRTFNYTSTCPKCKKYAGRTRICVNCKRFFAISEWPHKDMTSDECDEFQRKLHLCPYCKSPRTYLAYPKCVTDPPKKKKRNILVQPTKKKEEPKKDTKKSKRRSRRKKK